MNQTFDTIIKGKTLNIDLRQAGAAAESLDALCTDLFLIVMNITPVIDMGPEADTRKLLHSYVNQFERNCSAARINHEKMGYVKYALVALIDEKMMKLPEKWSSSWRTQPLQLDFFGDIMAGERFFEHLNLMMKNPSKYYDVLEIYYLCLCLGFKGMYHNNQEALHGFILQLPRMIINSRPTSEPAEPPPSPDDTPQRRRIIPQIPTWVLTSVAATLIIGTWICLRIASGNIGKALLPDPEVKDRIEFREPEPKPKRDYKAIAKKTGKIARKLKK